MTTPTETIAAVADAIFRNTPLERWSDAVKAAQSAVASLEAQGYIIVEKEMVQPVGMNEKYGQLLP